jgi:Acetyltransferases, including N-acetylases of ribosomal proteins
MSIFRKIVHTLSPQKVDVMVYVYDLAKPIPDIQAAIPLDIKTWEEKTMLGKRYVFFAYNGGKLTNRLDLVTNTLLTAQLGLKNYPVISNGTTKEQYRGNNIQGQMTCHLLRFCKQQHIAPKVYAFIAPDNHASIKVMEQKVGYQLLYRTKLYRLLGLVIYKSIIR